MRKKQVIQLFDDIKFIVSDLPIYRKSLINFGEIIEMLLDELKKGKIETSDYLKALEFINYFLLSAPKVAEDFGLSYKYYKSDMKFKRSNFVRVAKGRYITKPMFESWTQLLDELKEKLPNKTFSITSAYRSPAYQFYVLCTVGAKNNLSLPEVFVTVAPPFHSKHGLIPPAIDILEFFDSQNPQEVRLRNDWKIFVEAAKKFGFYESYPDGDIVNGGHGEPWEFVFI